jgi:hypothetical protein
MEERIDRRELRIHLEKTMHRYWFKGKEVNVYDLTDQVMKFLNERGVPLRDSDWTC